MLYFERQALFMGCLLGLAWSSSACDLAIGLNDFRLADASVAVEEPDTGVIPHTFTIGMISSVDDRVAQRQHGASLAVEVINQEGGVPDGTGRKRTLTLATATGASAEQSFRELERRGELSAVIGPGSSDDMLELLKVATLEAQLFTVGPHNSVDSVVEAADADLSWSLVPTDRQRTPLMMRALSEVEASLRAARGDRPLRLSIVYRDDALGQGWRAALENLSWGGSGLLHADNAQRVLIEPYDPHALDLAELVQRQVAFAPDVVLVIGMSEAVTQVIAPLEELWPSEQRPEYMLTDATKGAELLALVAQRTELMPRVHGIGAAPTAAARTSYQSFLADYALRFPAVAEEPVGVEAATAYDAVFVIAYALAASKPGLQAGTGADLSRSLRLLAGGELQAETYQPKLIAAFTALARGEAISARGMLSSFEWDSGGGIASGAAELWCVVDRGAPRFASTGLTFDIATWTFGSQPSECEPTAPTQTMTPPLTQPAARAASLPTSARPASMQDAGMPDASEPVLPEYSISVLYQANDTVPNDSSIRPFIRVVNAADGEYAPLRELSLRYYIDNEHAAQCPANCVADVSYAGTQPSGRAVRAQSRFVAVSGSQGYLEVTFQGNGDAMLGASETLEVQQHFHTMPYLPFDETNDYSFDPTARTFRRNQRITAFVSGVLAWGIEPML